eukprot:CAMPEP_0203761784 /NCGR_PEP_ID=MMETSP0098-20131031/14805_1 /ASSEMBLY_ACC=CAM_ASM_000208 /TAXON_ID=96639 /ORGANISM=" , Strain NY0313808BC1" /LENGTH=103 /DNA_ID=CAMNT_0050655925 /DNA_START=543 /DNA_END=855 /DNA_ORIENTATION=-
MSRPTTALTVQRSRPSIKILATTSRRGRKLPLPSKPLTITRPPSSSGAFGARPPPVATPIVILGAAAPPECCCQALDPPLEPPDPKLSPLGVILDDVLLYDEL